MPAFRAAQVIAQNHNTELINFDWNEPIKTVRVKVDQDKARQLGISSQSLALSSTR